MKKKIALALSLAMLVFIIAGCGSNTSNPAGETTAATTQTETTAATTGETTGTAAGNSCTLQEKLRLIRYDRRKALPLE